MESINMLYDIVKHYTKDKEIELDIANKVARIEQDLDILQILKNHIVGVKTKLNDGNKEYYIKLVEDVEQNYGDVYLFINEEEYKKVKEWLVKGETK